MNDDDFLSAFEDCTLPIEHWNHRTHLRIAHLYATRHDLESAIDRMRSGVKAYNKVNYVSDALDQRYHETVTIAFMRLIGEAVALEEQPSSFGDFKQHWPQLLDKRALLQFYSRDRILSAEAKAHYVDPDLKPISVLAIDPVPD